MNSKWTAMLAASVRPHLNNDVEADMVSGSEEAAIVKRVRAPRPDGHIDVTLLEEDPETGDIVERVVTTDSEGDLRIGAGLWLKLGGCHRSTARRRAVRYFAGLNEGWLLAKTGANG